MFRFLVSFWVFCVGLLNRSLNIIFELGGSLGVRREVIFGFVF